MNDTSTNNSQATIEALTARWKETKAAVVAAQAVHLQSEIDTYNAVKSELPDKGTTTLATGLQIVTGNSEKWDQAEVAKIYQGWPVETMKFPFASEYKPDGKAISVIRDSMPQLYKRLSSALTVTPKKPAFKMKGEKE